MTLTWLALPPNKSTSKLLLSVGLKRPFLKHSFKFPRISLPCTESTPLQRLLSAQQIHFWWSRKSTEFRWLKPKRNKFREIQSISRHFWNHKFSEKIYWKKQSEKTIPHTKTFKFPWSTLRSWFSPISKALWTSFITNLDLAWRETSPKQLCKLLLQNKASNF
jgi:hypothetical protein